MENTTGEFKIDISENDDHQFNIRMTFDDGTAISPRLSASRRKLGHIDCTSYFSITTQAEYKLQMGSTGITFTVTTSDSDNCPVTSYEATGRSGCADMADNTVPLLPTTNTCYDNIYMTVTSTTAHST